MAFPLSNHLVRSICLILLFIVVTCSPPEDPITCSSETSICYITNIYATFPDRSVCQAANVAYPTTESELIDTVSKATKAQTKMKVATNSSASIPKLVCPDGQDALIISTKYLNHTLNIDKEAMTMRVESGATLRQLIDKAAKAGVALPYSSYWWGLSVDGILGNGAHRSSLWVKGSAVHDYVVQLRIVTHGGPEDGCAKVRVLGETDPDFNAAKLSLGVLGVISLVTFELRPMFKRPISYMRKDDTNLADEVVSFGSEHEFGDITWYPIQRKVVYRIDDRLPATTGDGLYDFYPFRSHKSILLGINRGMEEYQESNNDAEMKCLSGDLITMTLSLDAYGLTNDACAWDPSVEGEFFHQTAVSIDMSVVGSFIKDVKQLVELEPKALCGLELYNGILMRYVKSSSAYLGKQQDGVDFDFTYYRSKDHMTPRLFEDVLEETEQMAAFNSKVKNNYDPLGLTSSEWTDQILGLKGGVTIEKEGCALEGLCICSQDIHCAPEKNCFCRPGKVYKDARVCTRVANDVKSMGKTNYSTLKKSI